MNNKMCEALDFYDKILKYLKISLARYRVVTPASIPYMSKLNKYAFVVNSRHVITLLHDCDM